MTAEDPRDIIDRYEYPGTLRLNGYSDGVVEGIWDFYNEDDATLERRSLIISPK